MRKLLAKIRKILRDRRTRRFLTRFVSGVAAIVVFVTTYALVLPAITMEKEANCGIEAHQHDDSCYTGELICDIPESGRHHHDESCYSITSTLICGMDEHEHSVETGCYDEDGNLICEKKEHRHNDECYEETRELTCQIQESEGHQHTDECYEKVLTCDKEAHVHSTACYENDPVFDSAVAASTSSASVAATSAGSVSSAGMTLSFVDETVRTAGTDEQAAMDQPVDNDRAIDNNGFIDNGGLGETDGSSGSSEIGGLSETDRSSETASSGEENTEVPMEMTYGSENAGTGSTDASNAALTNADNSATALTSSTAADQYIPSLEAVDFNTVLNDRTGIYYHHVADGETVEDSSAIPAEDWNRIPNNTDLLENMDDVELGGSDLLRVYLSYTIPAGSLNATNPVARYRLPSNLHLTDSQVKAINENVNGLAGQYVDLSTLEITDPDLYNAYLGVEAVEGTRRPNETVEDYLAEQARKAGTDPDDAAEYISAVARVENVYDADGIYGEKDAYLGQDLIFTFAPYSIEKNQHEYDSTGKPTKAGQEIEGWLALDLNLGQVEFGEAEITTSTVDLSEADNVDSLTEDDLAEEGHIEDDRNEDEHSEDGRIEDDHASEGQTEDEQNANDNNAENSVEDKENNPAGESGEDTENPRNNTVTIERAERTAEIVFVEEGWDQKDNKIDQISTRVTVVEKTVIQTQDNDTEENEAEAAAENTEEPGAGNTEKSAAESTEESVADKDANQSDKGDTDQVIMPAMSFTDSIRVSTGKPAGIDEEAEGTLGSAVRSLPQEAEVSVRVEADEGTFPAGTTMVLKAVEDLDAVAEAVTETVENSDPSVSADGADHQSEQTEDSKNNNGTEEKKNLKTYGFQAVDITFLDKNGKEIQPAKPVRVAMTSEIAEQVKEEAKTGAVPDPVVVHVDDDGNAEQMELLAPEEIEPAQGKTEEELLEEDRTSNGEKKETETPDAAGETPSVGFTADSFSVYVIVYTVDFHWEVDGKVYDFSIPGGGFVTLQQLVEVLGISNSDAYYEPAQSNDIPSEKPENTDSQSQTVLSLAGVQISDKTRDFVADVLKVEFSNQELMWVGKATEESTVGGLKDANGLECQYSAELTEEQIAEINSGSVEAGDWALISVQPFENKEKLTVIMRSGDQFVINVTDAQINDSTQVKLHFVKENGTSFVTGEVTYADDTPVQIVNGFWQLDPEKLVIDSEGVIDLNQFKVAGYTLSNTHKSTYEDKDDTTYSDDGHTNVNFPHAIIGNELRLLQDGTLQYKLYYGNEDKAGWYWFNAGTEPKRDHNHWFHYEWMGDNFGDTNYTDPPQRGSQYTEAVDDNAANPRDYYLVYSPVPVSGSSSGSGGSSSSDLQVGEVGKSKTLNSNNDGTYTMELGVTTEAAGNVKKNGVNIIVVYDTSSSMTRRTKDPVKHIVRNETYYEWPKVDPFNSNTQYYNDSRAVQTQSALNTFLTDLYTDVANPDDIQLALIDFNFMANEPQTFPNQSKWTSNKDTFMTKVRNLNYHSGTNWADGLQKAMSLNPPSGNTNPTYVLLMTDGAPSQYWHSNIGNMFVSGGACSLGAKDEARAVVNGGRELYGIFSFGSDQDEQNGYITNVVNYAYNSNMPDHSAYAQDQDELVSALNKVLQVVKKNVAHTGVNYQDGIALDTTSTALKVNVGSNLGSITYSKTGGTSPAYTVVTNSDGSIQSFKVNGTEYQGAAVAVITYKKISGGTPIEGGGTATTPITVTDASASVYQCVINSGNDAGTYNMPIATLSIDEGTKVGDLNWDLSPLGMMENGATYKISFVVWPDQKAYDYVADLNNGTMTWNKGTQQTVYAADGTTVLYYTHGIAQYPNIVCYPGPTDSDDDNTYAALTNTMQEVTYYKATEESLGPETTTPQYEGRFTVYPETPDPMPLTATASKIEKQWNVDRNPAVLMELLYGNRDADKNWIPYTLRFGVYQDGSNTEYTHVTLGWQPEWDQTEDDYVWLDAPDEPNAQYGGKWHKVGTRWAMDFSIATGLMLSDTEMRKIGLLGPGENDVNDDYSHFIYNNKTYYILESGHDYKLEESPKMGYEFDFSSPVYHPMLVDNVLHSVTFTKDGTGKITGIQKMTSMPLDEDKVSSLKVENTLRGYIHLNKVVVGRDGTSPRPTDDTKFRYHILLENQSPEFEGDHIPWYAINGLFYHDDDFNYYHAFKDEYGHLKICTESGTLDNPYDAEIGTIDPETEEFVPGGTFDQNNVTGQVIKFNDGTNDKVVTIKGNRSDASNDGRTAQADMWINQNEMLSIANVPLGTHYTITETQTEGYNLVSVISNQPSSKDGYTISGDIVQNSDNNITYTNKVIDGSLQITKNVRVDGAPATGTDWADWADGEYFFTLTDKNGKPAIGKVGDNWIGKDGKVSITITNGNPNTVIVTNLRIGEYTITEDEPDNGTVLIKFSVNNSEKPVTNGVVAESDKKITVVGNETATASFTNNINTTKVKVRKVWADGTTDHDPITYKLYRTVYGMIDDPNHEGEKIRVDYVTAQEVTNTIVPGLTTEKGFTGTLGSSNSWIETVIKLPKAGTYTPQGEEAPVIVFYDYYVTEESSVSGYMYSIDGGELPNDSGITASDLQEGDYIYVITNEPLNPTDQLTNVDVQKEWKDNQGNTDTDLHKDDSIVFRLVQKKYRAQATYTYNGVTETKNLYPITVNLVDKNANASGSRVTHTTVVYVPEGASFTIDPKYLGSNNTGSPTDQHTVQVTGISVTSGTAPRTLTYTNKPGITFYDPEATFTIDNVDSAKEVMISIYDGNDVWKELTVYGETVNLINNPGNNDLNHSWSCEMYSPQGIIWDLDTMFNKVLNGEAYLTPDSDKPIPTEATFEYTMSLTTSAANGLPTVFSNGSNVQGHAIGDQTVTWKGSIEDLPLYVYQDVTDHNSYIYTYEMTEYKIGSDTVDSLTTPQSPTGTWDGQSTSYLVKWDKELDEATQTYVWTMTNQKKPPIDISIYKVDKDNIPNDNTIPDSSSRLKGASFKLVKRKLEKMNDGDSPRWEWVTDSSWGTNGESAVVSDSSQNPGVFSFAELDAGYYEIVEMQYPAGYIQANENPIFEVKYNKDSIEPETVLVYASGSNIGQPITGNVSEQVKIGQVMTSQDGETINWNENGTYDGTINAAVTVGNTPGAALPNTGGSGTTALYLLGFMLTAFAGAGLVMRKRRKAA